MAKKGKKSSASKRRKKASSTARKAGRRKAVSRKKKAATKARKQSSARKKSPGRKKKSRVRKKAAQKTRASSRRSKVSKASKKAKSRTKKAIRKQGAKRAPKKRTQRRPALGADFRLDGLVAPLGYAVALDADPMVGTHYCGTVQIDVELTAPTREIRLHAADLQIESACAEYGFVSGVGPGAPPAADFAPEPTTASLNEPTSPATHPAILDIGPNSTGAANETRPANDADGAPSPARLRTEAMRRSEPERELEAGAESELSQSLNPRPTLPSASFRSVTEGSTLEGAEAVREQASATAAEPPPADTPPLDHALGAVSTEPPESEGSAPERSQRIDAQLELDETSETALLTFEEPIPAGMATLHLKFEGALRTDLCGLYFAQSGEHRYAFTQLEASNARRFFPCFDEPRFKAPLQLSLTTDQDNETLSNSPIEDIRYDDQGRKTVVFAPTQPLPTYLYALAVGPLESSAPKRVGDTEIRIWHVPGKGALTSFAAEVAAESLTRLESYFDIAYPYEKLDLVAVPDFEIGAMENAGAVFFRETLLLVDPAKATSDEQKRAAEVIAHELAHMWFGDLVTMFWWDDLWLKESFATWMAYSVVDDWKPEWKMWHRFQHDRADAFDLDALRHTRPVYSPVHSPGQASEQYDAITYEKGASVVRMVEHYLGRNVFRDGVRIYMTRHAGGNASAKDLWEALGEASGQDVAKLVRPWIEQAGFPVLRVSRDRSGTKLKLRQDRFLERKSRTPDRTRWPIPWVGRRVWSDGRVDETRALLTRVQQTLDGDVLRGAEGSEAHVAAVYGNAEEGGFFRVLPDPAEGKRLLELRHSLSSVERVGLYSHLWAAVRAGIAPLATYLEAVEALADEEDADVLQRVEQPLAFLAEVAAECGRDELRAYREFSSKPSARLCCDWGSSHARSRTRKSGGDGRGFTRSSVASVIGRPWSAAHSRTSTLRCGEPRLSTAKWPTRWSSSPRPTPTDLATRHWSRGR